MTLWRDDVDGGHVHHVVHADLRAGLARVAGLLLGLGRHLDVVADGWRGLVARTARRAVDAGRAVTHQAGVVGPRLTSSWWADRSLAQQLRLLTWAGHSIGRLAEPVTGHVLPRGVVLVGPVHRLGLDPRHDGVALELPDLLPQISVGLLSIFI